jgi:hypothetical protein
MRRKGGQGVCGPPSGASWTFVQVSGVLRAFGRYRVVLSAAGRRWAASSRPLIGRFRRSEGWWWRVGAYAGFCLGASAPWSGSHPRRPSLSAGGCPPAPAAYPGVSADGPSSPCVALLPMGFAEPPGSPRALVRSYRTISPLPVRGRSGDRSRHRRSVLCGTFLRVAPTGCYPAPCPVESGRSSGRYAEAPGTRPPGRLATTPIVALRQPCSHRDRQLASFAVTLDTRRASRGRWR